MITILTGVFMAIMGLGMATCTAAGLYIAKCDEMTRESMGVKI